MMQSEKLSDDIKAMIRVNQAGEYGATRIYAGQLAVLKRTKIAQSLTEMAAQEEQHLQAFNHMSVTHNVQPTILQPLWYVGGYLMGAATALLGEKAAHACTIAVEEVIADHYQEQLDRLERMNGPDHDELKTMIAQFRADEIDHKKHAESEGGRQAPAFELITGAVKTISRAAIWLSTRV